MPLTLVTGPANAAKAGEVLGGLRARVDEEPILVVPDALREDEHPAAAFNRDGTRSAVAHPKDRETTVWRAERASESGAATRPAPGQIP